MRPTKNKLPMGDLFEAASEAKIAELEAQIARLKAELDAERTKPKPKREKAEKPAPRFAIGDTVIVSSPLALASSQGITGVVVRRFWVNGTKLNPKEGFVVELQPSEGRAFTVWEDLLEPK